MTTHSELPTNPPAAGRIFNWPSTRPGKWAVGLAAVFVVMFIINAAVFMQLAEDVSWRQTVLPFYGIAMLLCGLASGILGLIAILRQRERSFLVWLPLLFALWVVFMLLGEFLVPH